MRISDWSSDVCSSDLRSFDIALFRAQPRIVKLAPKITAFCRHSILFLGRIKIALNHPAILIEAADIIHRFGIPQPRCLAEPVKRRTLVLPTPSPKANKVA